ncbi:hypothetical protein GGF42_002573 [Coemansia sp. RSA 2424]|nr:hypothetical protein GGF42_002573 [Coemansia sp. RSA 2424]
MSAFTPNPVHRFTLHEGSFHIGMSIADVTNIMGDATYAGPSKNNVYLAGNVKYYTALKSREPLYLEYTPFSKDADKTFVWFKFGKVGDDTASSPALQSFGTSS